MYLDLFQHNNLHDLLHWLVAIFYNDVLLLLIITPIVDVYLCYAHRQNTYNFIQHVNDKSYIFI